MPRPKSFDVDEVLDRAVEAFWIGGFAATSIEDLVQRLGINRRSLYDTFGSKEELYEQAVQRYVEQNQANLAALLADRGTPLRERLRVLLTEATTSADHRGCLVLNTGTERGATSPSSRAMCTSAMTDVRALLEAELAASADELAPGVAPREAADTLVVTMNGLLAVSTTDGGIDVAAVIERTLAGLFDPVLT